jgi:hypothetical protein
MTMTDAKSCGAVPRKPRRPRPAGREIRPKGKAAVDDETLARWIRRAKQLPPVRKELVERIRAEINAGDYETPERLEAAVERLLQDLRGM